MAEPNELLKLYTFPIFTHRDASLYQHTLRAIENRNQDAKFDATESCRLMENLVRVVCGSRQMEFSFFHVVRFRTFSKRFQTFVCSQDPKWMKVIFKDSKDDVDRMKVLIEGIKAK